MAKKRLRIAPDPGSPLHDQMQDAWKHPALKTVPILLRECWHAFIPGATARPDRLRFCWCYQLPGSPLLYCTLRPRAEDALKQEWWKTARDALAKRVLHHVTNNRLPWKRVKRVGRRRHRSIKVTAGIEQRIREREARSGPPTPPTH